MCTGGSADGWLPPDSGVSADIPCPRMILLLPTGCSRGHLARNLRPVTRPDCSWPFTAYRIVTRLAQSSSNLTRSPSATSRSGLPSWSDEVTTEFVLFRAENDCGAAISKFKGPTVAKSELRTIYSK
jgi:hypothetical protein